MKHSAKVLLLSGGLALLAGCASHPPAPVVDRTPPPAQADKPVIAEPEANFYVVQKGDTLTRVAAANKVSVKDMVAWNKIEDPNKVEVGQRLRIVAPSADAAPRKAEEGSGVAEVKPVTTAAKIESRPLDSKPATAAPAAGANTDTFKSEPKAGKLPYSPQAIAKAQGAEGDAPKPAADAKPATPPAPSPVVTPAVDPKNAKPAAQAGTLEWSWPVPGKVLKTFDGNASKGVDIAANLNDPVIAAAPGKVVYAGTGIRGYGKLVIIKHENQFLSAYANNSQILVKEGQAVTKGQKIAKVGKADGADPLLHFEIRREGKPADPLKYLPARE